MSKGRTLPGMPNNTSSLAFSFAVLALLAFVGIYVARTWWPPDPALNCAERTDYQCDQGQRLSLETRSDGGYVMVCRCPEKRSP